ncbi:MAG TPA: hypothetical protein VKB31_09700 [Trueperaceae bacterium]|nr:hypothetical protein [Trueperaceae bacterium]
MSALVVMLLLAFFLVIAVSLTIWAALGLNQHAPVAMARREPAPLPEAPLVARPSNDDVRGARVKVKPVSGSSEDAFERFLRSDSKRDDSRF